MEKKKEKQRNMKHDTAHPLSTYVTKHRVQQKMSIRGLAAKAGLDSGALTRLEHGETRTPTPETLRALAEALDVPLSDLYAVAGHVVPYDLPSLVPYLQTRYGELPDTALAEASAYLEHLIDQHGLEPEGPLELEDEATTPPRL